MTMPTRFPANRSAVLLALVAAMPIVNAVAEEIRDPIQHMIDKGGIDRSDSLLVTKLDWNEDGTEDYVILPKSYAGFNGGVSWTVYVSNNRGAYEIAEPGLEGPFGDFMVNKLSEVGGKLAIIRFARVGSEGAQIDALYLEGNKRIAIKPLAFVSNPERTPNATEEEFRKAEVSNRRVTQRFIESSTVIRPIEIEISSYEPPRGNRH